MPAIDTPLFLWINAGEHTWVGWIELARFSSLVLPTALVLACALGCAVDPSTRRQAGRLLASMALAWLGARMIQAAVPMARPVAIGDTFELPEGEPLKAIRTERRTLGATTITKVFLS